MAFGRDPQLRFPGDDALPLWMALQLSHCLNNPIFPVGQLPYRISMDTVLGVTYDGGGKFAYNTNYPRVPRMPRDRTFCVSQANRPFISFVVIVIIAADQSNGRSILTYQTNLDKISKLTSHSMMGVSGPNCDLVNFTE